MNSKLYNHHYISKFNNESSISLKPNFVLENAIVRQMRPVQGIFR